MFFQRFDVPVRLCNSRGEKRMHHCNWGKFVIVHFIQLVTCIVSAWVIFTFHLICLSSPLSGIIHGRHYVSSTFGFPLDCLHVWRDWDLFKWKLLLLKKLDNWMEPVCSSNAIVLKASKLCENVKTEKGMTAGNNEQIWLVDAPLMFFHSNPCRLRPSSSEGNKPRRSCLRVDWEEKDYVFTCSSPPYCSNQQSTNQLTANKPVEVASLFHVLVACNALCKQTGGGGGGGGGESALC